MSQQAFSYHVNKITNAQDTRGRGLKPLPKGFDRLYSEYKNGDISARSAATKLGITHPTFLKYVKECDVRLHKDDLVQTHNPRGLTERHAAATDAARNLNHDQDAPDSPLQDIFLDMNNLYNPAIIEAIYGLGTVEDIVSHSGSCSYPAFTFDADVISQMRNTQEFMDANTPDDYKLVAVKVGYNFALVPKIELSGIETNATETIVDISGKQYGLLAGKTFEDSQKLDAVLDMFPEYAIKDYRVPNKISVFIMPVQMYWKDDPSEIIETNFSFEDTCGLAIDDSVTFSGYTQNELVDMIGREDNGEDFVITGVGAGHYVGTCKKEPSKNKSVSEKTCNARESSGRLDADRNVDRNDIAKDKEVK